VFFNGYKDGGPQALGKYDICEFSSTSNSYPDPDSSDSWLCSSIPTDQKPDGINYQGYCDPKMDDLLNQQATTPDRDGRIKLYSQIEQLMYDQVIYVGMWKDPDLYSVNNRLHNVRFAGTSPFWNADEWTVTP
jgi:ABC-type transport system substrate-binding protein